MAGNIDEQEIRIIDDEEYVIDKNASINAPFCTTLRCWPDCDKCCVCSKCCYNCCSGCSCCCASGSSAASKNNNSCSNCCWKISPCIPFCYYCFPCCCCCCRPVSAIKKSDGGTEIICTEGKDDKWYAKVDEVDGERIVAPTTTTVFNELEKDGQEEEVTVEEEVFIDEETGEEVLPSAISTGKPIIIKKKQVTKLKTPSKTKPKFYTGVVTATQPASAEQCLGEPPEPAEEDILSVKHFLDSGAYLIYTEEKNGILYVQWSKEIIEGAGVLAYIKPTKVTGDFKYKQNEGKVVLQDNIITLIQSSFPTDRAKYFAALAKFFKISADFNGEIMLLPSVTLFPPPIVQFLKFHQNHVEQMKVGAIYKNDNITSIAVVPKSSKTFDTMQNIELSIFLQRADNEGASVTFHRYNS